MTVYRNCRAIICLMMFLTITVLNWPAYAQDQTTSTGTIASSSRNTLTVRTSSGQFQLFYFASNVRKPATLPVGTQVRVVSSSGNEPGVRIANDIIVLDSSALSQTAPNNSVIPDEVFRLERDIERQARRYQIGVRSGVALSPELVLIGAQAQLGPFFRSDVFFRPNVEFGFGEVTAMFAFNPEFIYRLPVSSRQDRWTTYFGAGVGINLVHQNFEEDDDGSRIDFGDFNSDTSLNILGGMRNRNGMFMELRTSVYSNPSPTLRLVVGYTF